MWCLFMDTCMMAFRSGASSKDTVREMRFIKSRSSFKIPLSRFLFLCPTDKTIFMSQSTKVLGALCHPEAALIHACTYLY